MEQGQRRVGVEAKAAWLVIELAPVMRGLSSPR